jgi:hypothetical protein
MEHALAKLLNTVTTGREQFSILQIHARLKAIFEKQSALRESQYRLQNLIEQTGQ